MSIILRNLAFAIGMLAGVIELRGQGGPPMITDDPGTPGPGKWEINLAVAWAHRPAETSLDTASDRPQLRPWRAYSTDFANRARPFKKAGARPDMGSGRNRSGVEMAVSG